MDAFIALQQVLPRHALTRFVGLLAASEQPWIAGPFKRIFSRAYDISLAEAEQESLAAYPSFNAFFTRALKSDARPLPPAGDAPLFVSPADGAISQVGTIRSGELLQAKGRSYSLAELMGAETTPALAEPYEGGRFATIYLAPNDYHRVHAPLAGTLRETRAIPGTLFSVNGRTEAGIPRLFCRNERLTLTFDTAAGPLLMVLVGALIVGRIDSVFGTMRSPYHRLDIQTHTDPVAWGGEVGRFLLGSTVIICTTAAAPAWGDGLETGQRVRVREPL